MASLCMCWGKETRGLGEAKPIVPLGLLWGKGVVVYQGTIWKGLGGAGVWPALHPRPHSFCRSIS